MRWQAPLHGIVWAWVLWQRAEFSALQPGPTSSASPERMSTPHATYGTVQECETAKVKLFQDTSKQYEPSASNQSVESVNVVPNEMILITFRGRGGSVALQFRCLPDNVDPRAPKQR
jgi:hypothetical protein